jgi:hypothetical protein
MYAHALALLPPTPSPLPPAAEEAAVFAVIPPVNVEEVATVLLLPLLPLLPLLLTIALRQPPDEDECELQNESYVSVVVLCVAAPKAGVTGPGAVGMSKVFDGRNDERDAGECECMDADGGGFFAGAGLVAGAGECIRLDTGGGAGAGERVGVGACGDRSVGMEAGAGAGVGEGEWECVWASDGNVA